MAAVVSRERVSEIMASIFIARLEKPVFWGVDVSEPATRESATHSGTIAKDTVTPERIS
jgi:hypothetical protein